MNITVGTAPDSWGVWFARDSHQIPWDRFLDEVVEAGYQWIELGPYGYLPTDLGGLRAELDRRGLRVSASAVAGKLENAEAWPALESELAAVGELLAGLDARYVILIDETYTDMKTGDSRAPAMIDGRARLQLVDTTHRAADFVRDRFGLRLLFHPHADTHVEYESQIEDFLAQTDPERVSLCFDTGHHAYRGGATIHFIRRHYDRIAYLHIKSVDSEIQQEVDAHYIPLGDAVAMGIFCEPAHGMIDFRTLRDALEEIDYSGFGIVEQDMYPAPFDKPLPIAKRSRAYLRELGIG